MRRFYLIIHAHFQAVPLLPIRIGQVCCVYLIDTKLIHLVFTQSDFDGLTVDEIGVDAVENGLRTKLPSYMQPDVIELVESMPVNAHGLLAIIMIT